MIKCYPFTKTVQASAMKACFRIAERRLSSTKIQNLAPPLQVFREENETLAPKLSQKKESERV